MFDFDLLRRSDKIAVHCPDKDTAIAFVREFRRKYPSRYFTGRPGVDEYWSRYKKEMCYVPNMQSGGHIKYCSLEYYIEAGFEIIPVESLMICLDIGDISPSDVDMKCLFGME